MGWMGLDRMEESVMDGMEESVIDGMGQGEVLLGVCQDGQGAEASWDLPRQPQDVGLMEPKGWGLWGLPGHGGSDGSQGAARTPRGCGWSMGSAWMVRGHLAARDLAGPRPCHPSSSAGWWHNMVPAHGGVQWVPSPQLGPSEV